MTDTDITYLIVPLAQMIVAMIHLIGLIHRSP